MTDIDNQQHIHSRRILVDGRLQAGAIDVQNGVADRISLGCTCDSADHDLADTIVAPKPLDLHFHGAGGISVPPAGDATALREYLTRADHFPAQNGPLIADVIPTLPVPGAATPDTIVDHVAQAATACSSVRGLPSIRVEGLFISPACAGVWPLDGLQKPDVGLLRELISACSQAGCPLSIIDIAPELDGAIALIEAAAEQGVVASLAHTDATYDQAIRAIDAGATLATHVWNAMRPIHHRDPGVIAAVLNDSRVTAELICDELHVAQPIVQLTQRAKGSGGWVAISDASPFAGSPEGVYEWAGTSVVHDGGSLRTPSGDLAGSAHTLGQQWSGALLQSIDLVERVIAVSAAPRRVMTPARGLGVERGDELWLIE